MLACKNSCLSSLFATFIGHFTGREICTLATEFHTGDIDQCLHKSGSNGVPNVNLFDFKFLLGDYGKVLCSAGNELEQNSNASCRVIREYSISQILQEAFEFCLSLFPAEHKTLP